MLQIIPGPEALHKQIKVLGPHVVRRVLRLTRCIHFVLGYWCIQPVALVSLAHSVFTGCVSLGLGLAGAFGFDLVRELLDLASLAHSVFPGA